MRAPEDLPNIPEQPTDSDLAQKQSNEVLEKPSILRRAKELVGEFRQRVREVFSGQSEEQITDVTGDALSDFAISEADKPQTVDQSERTAVAFVASGVEAVEDGLIGQSNDPIKKEVLAGDVDHVIGAVEDIAEAGDISTAEIIAHDVDVIEVEQERLSVVEKLKDGVVTAAVYLEGAEGLSTSELKKLKNQTEAWIEDRQEWHREELSLAHEAARDLSEKLGHPPRIIAMRGGCGSGKSYAVRSLYGDRGIFDEQGDVPGAVKPDYFKTRIKQKELETPPPPGVVVTSEQVHLESTGMNAMFVQRLAQDPEASLLIDKQLEAADDITSLVEMGKEHGKSVELLDNDVPIELSAFRVLKRQVGGVDPNIRFDGVSAGFRGIRVNREAALRAVESEDIVTTYSLRAFDPKSKQQIEIATKRDGEVVVRAGYEELAEHVINQTQSDTELEIQEAGSQIITEEYIESFIGKFFDDSESSEKYKAEARKILGAYVGLGMTIEEALASKADGIEADPDSPAFTEGYRSKLIAWKAEHSV